MTFYFCLYNCYRRLFYNFYYYSNWRRIIYAYVYDYLIFYYIVLICFYETCFALYFVIYDDYIFFFISNIYGSVVRIFYIYNCLWIFSFFNLCNWRANYSFDISKVGFIFRILLKIYIIYKKKYINFFII
jgi:hypothetical protein